MTKNPGKRALKAADVRETPRSLFDQLNAEFRFTLDAAATDANRLCDKWFTEKDNALVQSWAGERVWCNPPFTLLQEFTDKAWAEAETECTVMLVPANRTGQPWWQRNVAPFVKSPHFTVRWLAKRTRFTVDGGKPILNAKGTVGSPSFACALLIWS